MVLGYGGFFGLSSTQYRSRLKEAELKDLKKQEIVKTRTRIAAGITVYLGILSAFPSYGGSLVMSAVQARRLRVAHRKLALIREELERRGVDLHELRLRDVAIPVTGIAVGTGVGMGLEIGLGSFISAGDMFVGGPSAAAEDMDASFTERLHAILEHPDELYRGFSAGLHEEGDLLSIGAHGIDLHIADAGNLTSDTFVADPTSIDEMMAEVAGEQLGLAAAVALEKMAADLVSSQLTQWIIEASEDWPEYPGCHRNFGVRTLICDGCRKGIDTGTYMRKCDKIIDIRSKADSSHDRLLQMRARRFRPLQFVLQARQTVQVSRNFRSSSSPGLSSWNAPF